MITTITSKSNETIINFNKLKQKKYRDQYGQALLEGERLVVDAMSRDANIVAIILSSESEGRYINAIDTDKYNVYILSASVYASMSMTENSQGIIAVVRFEQLQYVLPESNFLILDNISDPGNMGTIIRTALAGGIKDIYCINCVDYRNEKVLRATMGTIFDVRLYNIDEDKALDLMKKYTTLVTQMQGKNVYNIDRPQGVYGIVMGNEANGVSERILSNATSLISIPMQNDVESLNVAVATAVIIYILNNKGE